MYLEEETLRLSRDTRMLCHIISQIKTLFWMSSSSAPTTLARQLLDKDNLVADADGPVLMVWGCNMVDKWEFIPSPLCHQHPKVRFWISEDTSRNHTGYYDPATEEILSQSPVVPCRPRYVGYRGGVASVQNGSVTMLNTSLPHLSISPLRSNYTFNPPSWERDTTAASNHAPLPVTYEDVGGYVESLGYMIHHIHKKDITYLIIIVTISGVWILFLSPLYRMRRDLREAQRKIDTLLYLMK
ncbi:unnamed protein product [Parnassius apollo]|uniref:(apollo) hypothetical protein n=1 Tax=Parnassius apollo TaxID=110799 RepID=A0A8S3YDY2_PARAO|nr:unnamed protein product [Parnassius apollo]